MGFSVFVLIGALCMQFALEVNAMSCDVMNSGIELKCPSMFNDNDKAFCCYADDGKNLPYCCDVGDYIQQNSAILAGILVGSLIILIIITVCCCCFCSCCLLAKRRTQRGRVIYAPVVSPAQVVQPTPAPVSSPYPLQPPLIVHSPPPQSSCCPYPQQNPPPYPHDNFQPPVNPNYKY